MSAGNLKPRWGQPLTGIIATLAFFVIAWATWYVFGDPRGPIGWFPQPFVMILAMMILVGVWMHMLFANWPFQNMASPVQGVVMTAVNAVLVWVVIEVFFYRLMGSGVGFLDYYTLEAGAKGMGNVARAAVVGFILIGFFAYPVFTILLGKWPVDGIAISQPRKGAAELGVGSTLTLIFYVLFVAPHFTQTADAPAWWTELAGTNHLHWTFGWYEWCIVILFLTATVWRGKPWTALPLAQPYRGFVAALLLIALSYAVAVFCNKVITPAIMPAEAFEFAKAKIAAKHAGVDAAALDVLQSREIGRVLWHHAAELAGFFLFPFLIWHNFFDDKVPGMDTDSWGAFAVRTIGCTVLVAIGYYLYYHVNFGSWALGNPHMSKTIGERWIDGESLLWNFWFIIPLLWCAWFFNKWPFYSEDK